MYVEIGDNIKKYVTVIIALTMILPVVTSVHSSRMKNTNEDLDPLVDIEITVEIKAMRYLETELSSSFDETSPGVTVLQELIKRFCSSMILNEDNPNFYLKVFINNKEFTSDIWTDSSFVYEKWTATLNVPDDQEFVDIQIQLWNAQNDDNIACDISRSSDSERVELTYSIKTGKWNGDDSLRDSSGYGRLCGTDDGTIYQQDNDCEVWFTIYQNDYDGDGIPYWTEEYDFHTNPKEKNDDDIDNDKIPIFWEYKWGYDPFEYDNHEELDPDGDSISNYEEYLTSEWLSDPFRKDVFVELDMMENGPNGEEVYFPRNSEELLTTSFNRQNIVFHLDYGDMGGHDKVPFDNLSTRRELETVYNDYFLHGNNDNWRRGVFHYGIVTYQVDGAPGWCFRGNAFQLASRGMEDLTQYSFLNREIIYASGYMHELGHTFSFFPIPGHNRFSQYPWQLGYWINRPYKSCMNYGWVYTLVDYSDGSHMPPDIDDWERIDYEAFEDEWTVT